MDIVEARTEPDFFFDLSGRVRNMSLPASPANALIPLFEAVSNALHAVEGRWREAAADAGEIEILVHRRDAEGDAHIVGFTVRDNRIGLTEANWKSFRTSESDFEISRGGKGVGRLVWLKTFNDCNVVSRFEADGAVRQRSYSFSLRGPGSPIHGRWCMEAGRRGGSVA